MVKPLEGYVRGYLQVSIAQGGPLHSVIGNFISALDGHFITENLKVRSSKLEFGESCHLHTLTQHMAVSVDANHSHS
jgi:hypothetical protein